MTAKADGAAKTAPTARTPRARDGGELLARETSEFDRGLSFYDAIYGFAITLLIANVDAPPAEAWRGLPSLLATGVLGQLGGFALSFVVIAVFWRLNVRLLKRLTGMDSATTTMNLIAAGFVVLLPFTTQGLSDPATDPYVLPTILYALNIAIALLAQLAMFEVARHRGLEVTPMTHREHLAFVCGWMPAPIVFLASIPVALLWGPDVGKLSWVALLVIGPVSGWLVGRWAARG